MLRRILFYDFVKIVGNASTKRNTFIRCLKESGPCRTAQNTANMFASFQRFYCTDQQANPELTVDYTYVKEAILNKNTLIVDVREPEELKEHGQIPNSINIPLGSVTSVLSSMTEEEFEKIYKKPKPTEDTEIIFYCMIGKRSGMAQQNVINLGYKKVKNYLGSWTDWASRF